MPAEGFPRTQFPIAMTATAYTLIVFFLFLITALIPRNPQPYTVPPVGKSPYVLLILATIFMLPVIPSGDKLQYEHIFEHIFDQNVTLEKDFGWTIYTKIGHFITSGNTQLYFFITTLIFVLGYTQFIRHYIPKSYRWYFALLVFGSIGFLAGGTNILRAGMSASIFMAALTRYDKPKVFVPLCFVALSLHLSMILPIVTFVLTRYYAKPKQYILIWCFFLVLSMLNATEFMQDYVSEASSITDSRLSEYIRHEDEEIVEIYTNAGFRPDFVLYSLFPILCGAFYIFRHGLHDRCYTRIFCMYIATNCFWLCVIRVPFGDRFALLSWIFAPFIVLYPLLNYKMLREQTKWAYAIMFLLLIVPVMLAEYS